MDARVGLWRKLSIKELMLSHCGVGEDSWDPLDWKEVQPVHSKGDQPWVFFGRKDAKAETPVLWPPLVKSRLIGKDSDAGRDWGQEEKGTTDGWMASLTWWMWIWVNSRSWWWTGRPGVLRFMGSQRVRLNWATDWMEPWLTDSEVTGSYHITLSILRCQKVGGYALMVINSFHLAGGLASIKHLRKYAIRSYYLGT